MPKPIRVRTNRELASRLFTDREEPSLTFARHVKELHTHKALVYYGVGGIGKSRLLRELFNKSQEPGLLRVILDLQQEPHRNSTEALLWMRNELKKNYSGLKFTTFDLAHTIYWKKINPHLEKKVEHKGIPFLEEGNFIGDLISQLENLPMVQWVPRSLKLFEIMVGYKEYTQWWTDTGRSVLQDLQTMHPHEIEERLLVHWALDISAFLNISKKKFVLFIDTYEALWETLNDRSFDREWWIHDLLLQFNESPVLFVIGSREKLRWVESDPEWSIYLEQHLIGELSPVDSSAFLTSCGILDSQIQKAIVETSKGLPYYLDLLVDVYHQISRERIPQVEDFMHQPQEVSNRLLRYLDFAEKETLRVLSITRLWNYDLFALLVSEFKTGYPLTAFRELCRFSFIKEIDAVPGFWKLHSVMRDGLVNDLKVDLGAGNDSLFVRINRTVFNYYNKYLNEFDNERTSESLMILSEVAYHAGFSLSEKELLDWILKSYVPIMKRLGLWKLLSDELVWIRERLSENVRSAIDIELGELYVLIGHPELAEKYSLEVIKAYEENSKDGDTLVVRAFSHLASLNYDLSHYGAVGYYLTEAIKLCEVLESREFSTQYLTDQATFYIQLGKLHVTLSELREARESYALSLKVLNRLKGYSILKDEEAALLGLEAETYEKFSELCALEGNNEERTEYILRSIKIYEKSLKATPIENHNRLLTYQGLAYKRLAEISDYSGENRAENFLKALSIYETAMALAPDYIDIFEMHGHACADLMELFINKGDFERAGVYYHKSIDDFKFVIDRSPRQASSRNRIASVKRLLGELYVRQGKYELALDQFQKAINVSDQLFELSPEYAYGYNTRGEIYLSLGQCLELLNQHDNAHKAYRSAQACFDESLKKSPNLSVSRELKEITAKKLSALE
jgi:tetratricopeptide (TPR) repeat protein